MEGLRAGMRTIGQVAGHEIHLEIEDVQDKIKITINCLRKIAFLICCTLI